MKHVNCAPTTVSAKNRHAVANRHVAMARKSMATSRVPSAAQGAAKVGAWRLARSCRRYAAGLPVKAALARGAPLEPRAAMPQAAQRPAIAVLLAASRLVRALAVAVRIAAPAVRTAVSAASRVAPVVATARLVVDRHRVAARKARVIRLTGTRHMAISPTATRPTATHARKARVVQGRKARVVTVRKALVGRRARVVIARTAVPGRKATVALQAVARQVAVAIVRVIAEPRLDMTMRGS